VTYHVGVDVGGTFTDSIAINSETGEVNLSKVPTTPDNQAVGFLDGLRGVKIDLREISWLVHGTTVGTNATLERNGAVCGMITTKGFRDVLEMGRRDRPNLFGLTGEFQPIIPRDRRIEVTERVDAEGRVIDVLDEEEVADAVRRLKERGCESVLVGFLHSYANGDHERRAAEIATSILGKPYITASADILAEFRELERFGTAAINAYIQPLIHRYVSSLTEELRRNGVDRNLAIMQANGGILSATAAWQRAVATVLSGPAAGIIAAAYISKQAGFKNVITCDMGGTSFDVGMIVDGVPIVTSDRDLDFRLPLRIPVIDIHTIGAGGGSIAAIDKGGMLKVGPRSAGSVPGPIAFRRGGTEPTVTDANVLLGRLSSEKLLSVEGPVDIDRVREAFASKIGAPLGLSAEDAAASVLRVINDAMAGAIRLVSLQRGFDPREFAIFAFGGAGPLHGTALARELGVPRVIVPYVPGITCALGCIVADVRHDFVQTVGKAVDQLANEDVLSILRAHRRAGEEALAHDQVPIERTEVVHEADMQYEGQTYTLRVLLDLDNLSVGALRDQLRQAFLDRFKIDLGGFRAKLINLRTSVIGIRPQLDLKKIIQTTRGAASAADARISTRDVWFGSKRRRTPVYDRSALGVGAEIEGPAIFNQMDTTTVIEPGDRAKVDEYGNLIVEVHQS
jgi:N-methylhydantoinase A